MMIKKLERDGYLSYESHRGCSLTEEGRTYGLRVLRRHRILETFLSRVLDFNWADIHDEAENLEHAASEKLIDAIDTYLMHPPRDPHGDPIPAKAQTKYQLDDAPITTFDNGSFLQITRVDGDRNALSYYQKEGLIPGTKIHILHKEPEAGLAQLSISGKESTFALSILTGVFAELDSKKSTLPENRSK